MAGGNASRTRGIAVVAAALVLLVAADAGASQCRREKRVDVRDAECLSASWKNPGAFKKSTYRVRNMCPLYGEVAAKIDLVGARDRTVNLDNGRARRGWAWRHIRSISCCSDTGICNRSDAVTDEACLARFKRMSTAPRSCRDISASANPSGGKLNCNVSAFCTFSPPPSTRYQLSTITVPFIALGNVHNCFGRLKRGPCDDDPPDTARVWVFDADAREVGRPSLDFRVYLSRILRETVRIDYATSDGTATAGSDYRATSGTLTFRPGETAKTVSVPVFDDGHDEGDERLTLTLSNPRPSSRVRLDDATAEGVIANADPVPRAWIGRFGRTVADQVLDAVDARMRAKPAPGVEARLAGQRIGAETAFPNPVARPHPPVGGDPVAGTSFSLTGETRHDGLLSIWGRGAVTRLAGRDAAGAGEGGDVAVDGEVATGLLGADWTRGRWTTGLVVTHSRGDGGYRGAGVGATASTLTGVWPWTRYALGERLSLWGAAGYGDGSLTLEPRAEDGTRARANRTDLDLWMASAGLRGVAVDGGDDGLTLAVKTDAMTVRTASDAVTGAGGNLAAAKAQVTRFRLGLEGSRPIRMADGSALTPSVEIGLRHDGGDAETGFGLDIGGGLAWSDTASGIAAEFRGRGLLIHEADGFRERGLSGSLSWDPPPASDRGPSASLTQTLGGHTSGGTIALLSRETLAGVAADDNGNDLSQRRLEARFGYGFPAFGARFTSAPEIALGLSNTGRDYSLGWRLARGGGSLGHGSLELSVQARRRENGYDRNVPLEHSVAFRAMSRF